MKLKVLLADDHEIILDGLCNLINHEADMAVVGRAVTGLEAVRQSAQLKPDLVIMDISLPELNGIEATAKIRESCEQVKVIALSVHNDQRFVAKMLQAGASGYLLKNSAFKELVEAIRIVARGDVYLSPKITGVVLKEYLQKADRTSVLSRREREVVQLIAEGKNTKQIGDCLCISPRTVERHRTQIMEKLNLNTVADLVKYALKEGITSL